MEAVVTIVVTPRDRYSGIIDCLETIYSHTEQAFKLIVLDLAYPSSIRRDIDSFLASKDNAKVLTFGEMIPMQALAQACPYIETDAVMLLDNDSRLTANWLQPLLDIIAIEDVAAANPLTLEREGVDQGAELRNHLYTNEIKIVTALDKDYLIEDKHYRRALPEDVPKEVRTSDMFELHGVMFKTKVLKVLELPEMVIREHIDLGIQLKKMGYKILSEPKSVVIFDNLGTRMQWFDMKYFFYRWSKKRAWQSSRLFEQRWSLNFYSEPAVYLWVFRRSIFLFCRWLYLPIPLSNFLTSIMAKLYRIFNPVWDPLADPVGQSVNFFSSSKFNKNNQEE